MGVSGVNKGRSVTEWGTSPKFLAALKQHGLGAMPNLENLALTLVTGSPLSVELSEWFYQKFPRHVATFSSSGGTDLVSASKFWEPKPRF